MKCIIEWCNNNTGFLTALLSILSLSISIIAVVVSLKTARMPYRKSLKLGSSYDFLIENNVFTANTNCQIHSMTITAANTGARSINLSFLGLAVKDSSLGKGLNILQGLTYEIGGRGILNPAEMHEARYKVSDLIVALSKTSNGKVFLYAKDTEGSVHTSFLSRANDIVKLLSSL